MSRRSLKQVQFSTVPLSQRPGAAINFYPGVASRLVEELDHAGKRKKNDCIKMGLGDCTIPLPPDVLEAHGKTLRSCGESSYPPILGLPELRSGCATLFSRVLDIPDITSSQVLIVPGSRAGIDVFIRAISRRSSNMRGLVAKPTWATFKENGWRACNAEDTIRTHELPKNGKNGHHKLTADVLSEQLDMYPSINLVILVNPHNPLGYVYMLDELKEIAHVLAKRILAGADLYVIEDATYGYMVYNTNFNSLLRAAFELPDNERNVLLSRMVVIMGLQKISMSGERVSSIIVPNDAIAGALVPEITAGHGATNRSAQELALALYSHSTAVRTIVAELGARRLRLARALDEANTIFKEKTGADLFDFFSIHPLIANQNAPGGGFYTMVRFSDQAVRCIPIEFKGPNGEMKVDTLMKFLIVHAGIICQPAATTLLDDNNVVRLSYGAASSDDIQKVPGRLIEAFLPEVVRVSEASEIRV